MNRNVTSHEDTKEQSAEYGVSVLTGGDSATSEGTRWFSYSYCNLRARHAVPLHLLGNLAPWTL